MYRAVTEKEFELAIRGTEQATQSSTMITLFWKNGILIARAEYFKNVFLLWDGEAHFLSVLN